MPRQNTSFTLGVCPESTTAIEIANHVGNGIVNSDGGDPLGANNQISGRRLLDANFVEIWREIVK
jgi:hypothetical protein